MGIASSLLRRSYFPPLLPLHLGMVARFHNSDAIQPACGQLWRTAKIASHHPLTGVWGASSLDHYQKWSDSLGYGGKHIRNSIYPLWLHSCYIAFEHDLE